MFPLLVVILLSLPRTSGQKAPPYVKKGRSFATLTAIQDVIPGASEVLLTTDFDPVNLVEEAGGLIKLLEIAEGQSIIGRGGDLKSMEAVLFRHLRIVIADRQAMMVNTLAGFLTDPRIILSHPRLKSIIDRNVPVYTPEKVIQLRQRHNQLVNESKALPGIKDKG